MGLKEEIKSYVAISGLTLTEIQNELNRRNGTTHGVQNLSKKINNETLRYSEIQQIADILGFNITWIKKDDLSPNKGSNEYQNFMVDMNNALHYLLYAMQNIPAEVIEVGLVDGKYDPNKVKDFLNKSRDNNNK